MSLELLTNVRNVQEGLRKLENKAYSLRQNMQARVDTPVLENETNLWNTWLDSKTMNLYGGLNEDKRRRFKIDHDFDLSMIVDSDINSDGSIITAGETYMTSKGTEFIVIGRSDLKGADNDYAIRADKYESIREQLGKGDYKVSDLEEAGGFRINDSLTKEEVLRSDGWKELAVGKNNASEKEYEEASTFLEEYVSKAEDNNCFRSRGMGFYVGKEVDWFKVRPWYVGDSINWSSADDGSDFVSDGQFLRVRDSSDEVAAQKMSPESILDYLKFNPVEEENLAIGLLNEVNKFYQNKVKE